MGAAFPVGLMLVAIAGGELFTGNTAYFIPPVASGKLPVSSMLKNWGLVYIGNFFGAIFVAYFVGYLTGTLTAEPWKQFTLHIAEVKTTAPFYKVFFKGMACNWFVAIAMWLAYASNHISGKILGIWFPIMAFVAMGFEHCVANMFFIPSAMLLGAPITWGDFIVNNLIPATLGNIAGGSILVGGLYWYAYGEKRS
jgi:formate/nitrite transporter